MRVVTCAVVLGMVAMAASGFDMDPRLTLLIDLDGSTYLVPAVSIFATDGYTIQSAGGHLQTRYAGEPPGPDNGYVSPDGYVRVDELTNGTDGNGAGWLSLEDMDLIDIDLTDRGAGVGIGAGAGTFGELVATAAQQSEVSLTSFAIMDPADGPLYIGEISTNPSEEDLTFTWRDIATDTTYEGPVEVIPEPTTMAVLGLGLLGFIARKKR